MASRYCSLFFSLPGLYTNICTEAQSPLSPYSLLPADLCSDLQMVGD